MCSFTVPQYREYFSCECRSFDSARLAGLVQGFGGTQRLPRLVGLQEAIQMTLTSKHVSGAKACKMGLVDKVEEAERCAGAVQMAHHVPSLMVTKPHGVSWCTPRPAICHDLLACIG